MSIANPSAQLKTGFTGSGSDNTPEGAAIRTGGKHVTNTITLSANNTSESVNVFQFTGTLDCLLLHAFIVDATVLTNCTGCYFDLWDGSVSVPLTKASPGGDISGFGVGSVLTKIDAASSDLDVKNNNQVNLLEVSGNKVAQAFEIIQKAETDCYIRFNYTTTDTPIDAQIKVDLNYADIDSGTITAV